MRFAWQAQGFRHFAKCVAGAGVREGCKNVGGRGGFEEDLKTIRFAWQAQGFRALRCGCFKLETQNPWKGCKFHVTEMLLCRDHFARQLQEFVCLGSTFLWQAQYF